MREQTTSNNSTPSSSRIGTAGAVVLGSLALFSFGKQACSASGRSQNKSDITQNVPRTLSGSMTLQERYFAIGTDLDISDKDGVVGKIEQRTLNLATSFDYRDNQGTLIATAKSRLLSFGTHIDIFDAKGEKIGSLRDQVVKNLFSWTRTFSIDDKDGNEIATSERLQYFATSITVRSRGGALVAQISRPSFNLFTDTWTVDIPGDIDKRLIIFIPSYKTHSDNQNESKSTQPSKK